MGSVNVLEETDVRDDRPKQPHPPHVPPSLKSTQLSRWSVGGRASHLPPPPGKHASSSLTLLGASPAGRLRVGYRLVRIIALSAPQRADVSVAAHVIAARRVTWPGRVLAHDCPHAPARRRVCDCLGREALGPHLRVNEEGEHGSHAVIPRCIKGAQPHRIASVRHERRHLAAPDVPHQSTSSVCDTGHARRPLLPPR